MSDYLDLRLANWIEEITAKSPESIHREIENRIKPYTELGAILTTQPLDVELFANKARQCTVLTSMQQYASTPFKQFFEKPAFARQSINRLTNGMRAVPTDAADHIDEFVSRANQKGFSLSEAALLASVILTAAYPTHFIDYPAYVHWQNFASYLGYTKQPVADTHGWRIVWASEFAQAVINTETFQNHWPTHSVWVVSALCWANKDLTST